MPEPARTKWDYIYYAMIAGTIFFFGMALVGFLGEVAGRAEPVLRAAEAAGLGQIFGWWNDVGEALMQVGSAGGAVLGGATLVVGSSRFQVEDTNDAVHATKDAVEDNGETLEQMGEHLSEQTRVLRQIRDRV